MSGMELPSAYLNQMKNLLKDEYELWLESMKEEAYAGLRLNTSKTTPKEWESIRPYKGAAIPWADHGYYYDKAERPAQDPYYYAGLYYLQEPSAMAPAAFLNVRPGDRVLDLCAAPGGKSTELGARVKTGGGLLVSNDISSTRGRALLKNLELFGIPNILVTSETPEKLAGIFGEFFDQILVDAPCSGEGMFRKDPGLVKSWLERGPESYAPLQQKILKQAAHMLRPGGYLLYSTCTFSKREDEDVIHWLLDEEPSMELAEIPCFPGACRGLDGESVLRLFPHRIAGEGHFIALFRKAVKKEETGDRADKGKRFPVFGQTDPQIRKLEKESDFLSWERLFLRSFDRNRMMIKDGKVYLLPEYFRREWKLRCLRTGLLLGEWKGKRFEPSQALAMALEAGDFAQIFSLRRGDERVVRYLKGETIFLEEGERLPEGWILICVDGYPLGWAKQSGGRLKNKYCISWRWK